MLYIRIVVLVCMAVVVGRTCLAAPSLPPLPPAYIALQKTIALSQGICDTRRTSNGGCCVFPFKYQGKTYYECTTKDHGTEWCATTDDCDRYPHDWGNCTGKPPKPIFDEILETNKQLLDGKKAGPFDKKDGPTIELFEGDILVDDDIRRRFLSNRDNNATSGSTGRIKRAAIKTTQRNRWKDRNGRPLIPYEIQASNDHYRSSILRAMQHLKAKVPCLRFVRHTGGMSGPYLSFHNGGGCWSLVGKVRPSGRQLISIGNGCGRMGTIAHEIMHALGFWHEQSRPDRDKYVTIKWKNIVKDKAHNFQKQSYSNINSMGVPYDYKSVMHYGPTFFAKPGAKYTIVGKGGRVDFGQRYGLSTSDALQLNRMYCGNTGPKPPRPPTPPPNPGCTYKDKYTHCPYWKSIGYCSNSHYKNFMRKNCKKSCLCKQSAACYDKRPTRVCQAWLRGRYCTNPKYSAFMRQACRKTCRFCR